MIPLLIISARGLGAAAEAVGSGLAYTGRLAFWGGRLLVDQGRARVGQGWSAIRAGSRAGKIRAGQPVKPSWSGRPAAYDEIGVLARGATSNLGRVRPLNLGLPSLGEQFGMAGGGLREVAGALLGGGPDEAREQEMDPEEIKQKLRERLESDKAAMKQDLADAMHRAAARTLASGPRGFLDGTYQTFLEQELRQAGQNAQARVDAAGSLTTNQLFAGA